MTVAEVGPQQTADDVAAKRDGEVVDPGPYDTYEEAADAMVSVQEELHDDATTDTPGTRVTEGREKES